MCFFGAIYRRSRETTDTTANQMRQRHKPTQKLFLQLGCKSAPQRHLSFWKLDSVGSFSPMQPMLSNLYHPSSQRIENKHRVQEIADVLHRRPPVHRSTRPAAHRKANCQARPTGRTRGSCRWALIAPTAHRAGK